MGRNFTVQELADFLFDRLIVDGPSCPDTEWLRQACQDAAADLLEEAEVVYKQEPVLDGGA
jgi:hypothetical protein